MRPHPSPELLSTMRSTRDLQKARGILWGSPLAHFEVQMRSRRTARVSDLGDFLAAQYDITNFCYEF